MKLLAKWLLVLQTEAGWLKGKLSEVLGVMLIWRLSV